MKEMLFDFLKIGNKYIKQSPVCKKYRGLFYITL